MALWQESNQHSWFIAAGMLTAFLYNSDLVLLCVEACPAAIPTGIAMRMPCID